MLPTQAYLQITGLFDLRGGAVLSFVLLVPALAVFLLQRYWVSRRYYVTVTGKGAGQTPFDSVSPAVRAALLAGLRRRRGRSSLYFYALLLYASLVVAFGANHAFTWQHYHVIFTEGLKAIRDTLIIAGFAMPLGGLYGVLVGYLVARKAFPGRRAMELVSMINYALPGHHRRHRLPDRLQRSADRADRHGADHRRLLRLPLQPDRHPRHRRAAAADRPSLEEASLGLGAGSGDDVSPRDAAADRCRRSSPASASCSSAR